jgi:hypothetical protein
MDVKPEDRHRNIRFGLRRLLKSVGAAKDSCLARVLDGTYAISTDRDETKSLLGEQAGVSRLTDYYESHNPQFLAQVSQFAGSIPVSDLNPYKPYPDSAYYVPTQSTQALNVLLGYAEHPDIRRNVVVFGNRGSGKTALINHWLHENNTALEGLDTFWVRCNAVHLFRLWTDREYDPTRLVTVDEYLDLQLVYVLAKYCLNEERRFLSRLFGLLEQRAVAFNKVRSLSTPNHVDITSVTKYLREHVHREIQQHEKRPRDSRMLQVLEPSPEGTFKDEYVAQLVAVGQETRGKERRHWSDCSKAIQEALIDSGVKILWILDGVDNIHMNHEKSLSLYNRMIGEVASFVRTKPPAGYLRLACMRQRTYLDCKRSPLLPYTKEYTGIREIDHRPADEKEIVKTRLTHLFGAGQTNEAGKLLQLVNLENKAWIDKIFHGNIRNYLHNCCTLVLTLKYRIEQGVTDIRTQVMIQRTRNLFLNGRFYLNTRYEWHNINEEQGIAVFNPFMSISTDLPTSVRDWEGLVRVRLLESLSRREASEPTALVRKKLIGIFCYREVTVDTAIVDCLAFELLEPFLVEGELRYRTTLLGEYVLRDLISNLDSLYYFSHDTPVPESLLDRSFFPAHRNSLHAATGYRASAVASVISFLMLLVGRDKLDRQRLREANLISPMGHVFVMCEERYWNRLGIAIKRLLHRFEESDYDVLGAHLERLHRFLTDCMPVTELGNQAGVKFEAQHGD